MDVVYLVMDWLINYVISTAVYSSWIVIHIIVEIDLTIVIPVRSPAIAAITMD